MFCLFEIIIEVLDPMDPLLANLSVLNLNSPRFMLANSIPLQSL